MAVWLLKSYHPAMAVTEKLPSGLPHPLQQKKITGKIAVRNKFFPHNIPDHILNPILDKLYVSNPPLDLVKSIIERRMQMRKRTPKEKSRLVNLLKRKGFAWDEIEPAINNINWNE